MGILENRKLEKNNREREHTRGKTTDDKKKMHKQNKLAKKKRTDHSPTSTKKEKENGLYLPVLQSRGNGVSFVVCSFVRVFPFCLGSMLDKKKKEREIKKEHQTVTRHWKS